MARTVTQFLTYVKYDFKRTDKDTEILVAYNDTIKHLSNLKALEGCKLQSWIPTVAGQEDYPLPSTKCHVLHPIRYIESSSGSTGYPLNKLNKDEFSKCYPNPNSDGSSVHRAKPKDYCIYSNSILVGPLPDGVYILELDWTRVPVELSADSDLHVIGSEWEEVIKFGTHARLYEGMGLTEEAGRFWDLYRHPEFGYPALMDKEEDQSQAIRTVKNNAL